MINDHLNELAVLGDIHHEQQREAARARLHRCIVDEARSDIPATFAALRAFDLSDPEQAFEAADVVAALASEPQHFADEWPTYLVELVATARAAGSSGLWRPVITAFVRVGRHVGTAKLLTAGYLDLSHAKESFLRLSAAELLSGCSLAFHPELRARAEELLRDRDWRVRLRAEQLLTAQNLLPSQYTTPIADRILRRLERWIAA